MLTGRKKWFTDRTIRGTKKLHMAQDVEFVVEPMDEFGDVIDPQFSDDRADAERTLATVFDDFPDATSASLVERTRWYHEDVGYDQMEPDKVLDTRRRGSL